MLFTLLGMYVFVYIYLFNKYLLILQDPKFLLCESNSFKKVQLKYCL